MKKANQLISKLSDENYPITRLTNKSFFRNNELLVYSGAFNPRPETESLVEIICYWIRSLNLMNFSYLDLCTGTGNIFISVLDEFEQKISKLCAIDMSFLSCKNVLLNIDSKNYRSRGKIYCSNWIKFLYNDPNWDVITMNPPYVSQQELNNTNLCKYEPKWALQAGFNGWSHFEKIVEFALQNSFWKLIGLECNEFHEQLWDNLDLTSKNIQINKYRDYLGKFRVVILIRI